MQKENQSCSLYYQIVKLKTLGNPFSSCSLGQAFNNPTLIHLKIQQHPTDIVFVKTTQNINFSDLFLHL